MNTGTAIKERVMCALAASSAAQFLTRSEIARLADEVVDVIEHEKQPKPKESNHG